jgi:hypothetical protein
MSETGNAKNVANYEQVTNIVGNLGAAYNPSQDLIKLVNLQDKLADAQNALDEVNTKEAAETEAVNRREAEFADIGKLATRIADAAAVNVNDEIFSQDVETFKRKLQGRRAGKKPVDDPLTPDIDESLSAHSTAQLSYDNLTANFAALIALLKTQADYAPNETALKIVTLEAKLAAMEAANDTAKAAILNAETARANRDKLLYDPKTGIVNLAKLVKKYVRSAFGADSTAFQQINALKFRQYKK